MKNFVQLASIDVRPALEEMKQVPLKMWKADTYLRDYPQGPFGDTESIILRFPPRSVKETKKALEEHLSKVDEHENVWQDAASSFPELKRIIYSLAYATGATRIGRCIVNKLNAGGVIWAHPDTPSHANYWCRYHVVIGAFPGVKFTCGDETVEMKTGDVWFFRNELTHSVKNESGVPRIHLVVDLRVEEVKPGLYPRPDEVELLKDQWDSYLLNKEVA
jgi:hypothetical protein